MSVIKRSLTIKGHSTSISLEAAFWDDLQNEALKRNVSVAALVAEIDSSRADSNLSSAIRVWVLQQAKAR